ncbi:MAG: hypothetical protein O7C72_09140 [Deltaproteobacteria bacterium]|nr:hypothetical protein [Deltaproteobacteria bacterium]
MSKAILLTLPLEILEVVTSFWCGYCPCVDPLPISFGEELWPFAPHVEGPPDLEWAFLEASMLLDDSE